MDISFKFDPEIKIGKDTLSLSGAICARYGQRILIISDLGINSAMVNRLKSILEDSGIQTIVFDGIAEDSTVNITDNIAELCTAGHCNAIIGLGGEKAQIIARMTAIMAPAKITSFELLEQRERTNEFLPFISIPTTGLNSFSLTNYFLAVDPRDRSVKSVLSPNLYAAVILDSTLFEFLNTPSCAIFIFEGFLAALEAYCSGAANFLSDALLERALKFYGNLLQGGIKSGRESGAAKFDADIFAQANFLASLGCALSSPGLGAVLSLAINARYPAVKHSAAAALLPVIAQKLVAARPEKMARIASYLGNKQGQTVADCANFAVKSIINNMGTLNVQTSLKNFDISLDKVTAAAEMARNFEFVPNSPWTVSQEAVFDILKQIIN